MAKREDEQSTGIALSTDMTRSMNFFLDTTDTYVEHKFDDVKCMTNTRSYMAYARVDCPGYIATPLSQSNAKVWIEVPKKPVSFANLNREGEKRLVVTRDVRKLDYSDYFFLGRIDSTDHVIVEKLEIGVQFAPANSYRVDVTIKLI